MEHTKEIVHLLENIVEKFKENGGSIEEFDAHIDSVILSIRMKIDKEVINDRETKNLDELVVALERLKLTNHAN